ncbi:unnamed protein product [Brachionus calyciflorus]|uniref:Uncharacterized protein n=1 Tax=Brachionus calyciflorus TaxID=104777 RepID=A0A814LT97_9BILA|nr:unnamed protein product [Brachionus calyciflorus]
MLLASILYGVLFSLNLMTLMIRTPPRNIDSIMFSLGYTPEPNHSSPTILVEQKFEEIEKKCNQILVKNDSSNDWTMFFKPYLKEINIMVAYIRNVINEQPVHFLTAFSTSILIYFVLKKGRQAYNSVCMSPVRVENKMYQLKSELNENVPAPCNFKSDGINFEIWIELFEAYARKYEPGLWKNLLCMFLDEEFLKQLPINAFTENDQMKKIIKRELNKYNSSSENTEDITTAIENFSKCFKNPGETIEIYLRRFLSLAAKAEITKESTLPLSIEDIISYAQSYETGTFAKEITPENNEKIPEEDSPAAVNMVSKNTKLKKYSKYKANEANGTPAKSSENQELSSNNRANQQGKSIDFKGNK